MLFVTLLIHGNVSFDTSSSSANGSVPVLLSASTKRNKIRYLCSACNYAFKKHGFGDHLPSERVSVTTVKNSRQNAPDRGEMLTIARAMPRNDARTALICAFYSGMRRGEVIRAVVKNGAFMLSDTKTASPALFLPIQN